MLNARHIFRLCKQSVQCSLGRPLVYFSSSSDDSNSKGPPKKKGSENESLDILLKATFSQKKSSKPASKSSKTAAKFVQRRAAKSDFSSLESASKDDSQPLTTDKKVQGNVTLKKILNDAYSTVDRSSESEAEIGEKIPSKPDTTGARTIDVAIERKNSHASSTELLTRIKKIAQDVAGSSGPNSKEVAEDLIRKLESTNKINDKPLDLNELTFEKYSKSPADQNLDLLRNKIVSEEQIYKISTSQHQESFQRWQPHMEFHEPWPERSYWMSVSHDLDISLNPKKNIGIFQVQSQENLRSKSCLRTYEKLEQRELDLSHSYAPRNWFEQCIQWTEQGKLWHFPINNEQGLEEIGKTVSFTEHIFLEDHLEGWCPTFGPVRHFMELVCLGLSRNPYLSVEEKIENILWYRDYFEQHKEILEASGTLKSGVTKVPALEAQ